MNRTKPHLVEGGGDEGGYREKAGGSGTEVTSRLQGVVPLSERQEAEFLELVSQYEDALCEAVEARLYKTGYEVSDALAEMSLRLGRLEAGARDVIEIHTRGVKASLSSANAFRGRVCLEEARLMTLELMGNLANFYRNYYSDFPGKRRQ
ncbi:MAG: hypothetical protein J0L64_24485 [Acidobacteria bacterium]|nr:hypothetical protein [Acidobacteriota bacterium]